MYKHCMKSTATHVTSLYTQSVYYTYTQILIWFNCKEKLTLSPLFSIVYRLGNNNSKKKRIRKWPYSRIRPHSCVYDSQQIQAYESKLS